MKYTLNAPEELELKLDLLSTISAFAKELELNELAKQAKDIYLNLSSQWDEYAKEEVNKRNPNWFSRTIHNAATYEYISANKWDTDYHSSETTAKNINNHDKLRKYLHFYLNLWNSGKTAMNLTLNDIRELEKYRF